MGVMGSLEKFFVNRANRRTSQQAFNLIRDQLHLSKDSSTLELGAGRGAFSLLLFQEYNPRSVTVTDYEASQVESAKEYFNENLKQQLPPTVDFRTADALNLPFDDGSFDAVFAFRVLHHLEKHEWHYSNIPNGLREIYRVLRPDGLFAYGETFNRFKIRKSLEQVGFEKICAKRSWAISDICVYRKKAGSIYNE
jgi:ubiquinone/menaquinone biosynthesis C-methylase UbiE